MIYIKVTCPPPLPLQLWHVKLYFPKIYCIFAQNPVYYCNVSLDPISQSQPSPLTLTLISVTGGAVEPTPTYYIYYPECIIEQKPNSPTNTIQLLSN